MAATLTLVFFQTLDGVVQAPGGPDEDRSGGFPHGGWLVPFVDAAFLDWATALTLEASGFLMGRGTYDIFAASWPNSTDPGDRVAAALNGLPKTVASRTLAQAGWTGSRVVADILPEVQRVKGEGSGDLQVHGSPGLGATLLEAGQVDRLAEATFPVVLGQGKRVFCGGAAPASLQLLYSAVSGAGAVLATYRVGGAPGYGAVEVQ
jgi:dihydrofolate reductase